MSDLQNDRRLHVGMVGLGMIFDETYRPLFEQLAAHGLCCRNLGVIGIELAAMASKTGMRAEGLQEVSPHLLPLRSYHGNNAVAEMLREPIDVVCVATPDDRHFEIARTALAAGKHVLIEKPAVWLSGTGYLDFAGPIKRRAGENRLSQTVRSRSQKVADARRRWCSPAR